jgi:hypothetical protein
MSRLPNAKACRTGWCMSDLNNGKDRRAPPIKKEPVTTPGQSVQRTGKSLQEGTSWWTVATSSRRLVEPIEATAPVLVGS